MARSPGTHTKCFTVMHQAWRPAFCSRRCQIGPDGCQSLAGALRCSSPFGGLGRIAFLAIGIIGVFPAILIDSVFLPCLLAVMAREIVVGRNWRTPATAGLATHKDHLPFTLR